MLYGDFVDILGSSQIGLYYGVISMHLVSFLKVYRMGDIFWVAKISSGFFFFLGGGGGA